MTERKTNTEKTEEGTTTQAAQYRKPASSTLLLANDRRLVDLIRLIRGQGIIGDVRKILDSFDLTKLPALIDLISTILAAGRPATRAEVTELLDNSLVLVHLFAEATDTPIDDQFADIVDQIAGGGVIRSLLERLIGNLLDVTGLKNRQLGLAAIDGEGPAIRANWAELFQLFMLIVKLLQGFWDDEDQ